MSVNLSGRWLAGLAVVAWCTASVTGRAEDFGIGPVAPSFDAVQQAARQVAARHCASADCRALVWVAAVLRIDLDAAAATVGRPRPLPANRDTVARSALNRVVLDHPDRFGAVCDVSARIVSGFSEPGRAGEAFVPISLLRLAQAMDRRSGGRCLPVVLARLPPTPAADAVIDHARQLCANDAMQTAAACGVIDRR
jgi:hypothetical protein